MNHHIAGSLDACYWRNSRKTWGTNCPTSLVWSGVTPRTTRSG